MQKQYNYMFAGIIEENAQVVSLEKVGEGATLNIKSNLDHSQSHLGDSIAIDGVCLTLVQKTQNAAYQLSFDLAQETLERSTLGSLKKADFVHLERSLTLGSRIHGHLVYGHVDTKIELEKIIDAGNSIGLGWKIDPKYKKYVVEKGSVSIAGVSLTVAEITQNGFVVYIIPHTQVLTKLNKLKIGDQLNFEVDMLARYIEKACAHE